MESYTEKGTAVYFTSSFLSMCPERLISFAKWNIPTLQSQATPGWKWDLKDTISYT